MSWTFKTGDVDPKQLKDFQTVVNEARGVDIVCFNSLDDKLENENIQDIHPLSNDSIMRIGSATKSGEKADQGKFRAANHLFHRQDIPITGDDKNQKASGSSVATALAAGLAGLILYSRRLLLSDTTYNFTMLQIQKLEAWSRKGLMNQAFNVSPDTQLRQCPRISMWHWDRILTRTR